MNATPIHFSQRAAVVGDRLHSLRGRIAELAPLFRLVKPSTTLYSCAVAENLGGAECGAVIEVTTARFRPTPGPCPRKWGRSMASGVAVA